jgi:hypothetical protein
MQVTFAEIRETYIANGRMIPEANEVWRHHSGALYYVDELRNVDTPTIDVLRFPPEVCYTQIETGWKFVRPLDDWHRSFGAAPIVLAEHVEPLYYARESNDMHAVFKRTVTRRLEGGSMSATLGGPIAFLDSGKNAKELAEILNKYERPDPNEPKW